jgi:hypothetical protein
MTPEERHQLIDHLTTTQTHLLTLVEPLTPTQWAFHETPIRWSTAQILEHLTHFEHFIRQAIQTTLSNPPNLTEPTQPKQPLIDSHPTPPPPPPQNPPPPPPPPHPRAPPADLITHFRQARAETIAFTAETHANLRDHTFPHIAFGPLDCQQWLELLARHTTRHIAQIQEIQTHPANPR